MENVFGATTPAPGVTRITEGGKERCMIDDSPFEIPKNYKKVESGELSYRRGVCI